MGTRWRVAVKPLSSLDGVLLTAATDRILWQFLLGLFSTAPF